MQNRLAKEHNEVDKIKKKCRKLDQYLKAEKLRRIESEEKIEE